jgi:hypothetical protein
VIAHTRTRREHYLCSYTTDISFSQSELSKLLPNTDVVRLIETHPKILSVNVGAKVRDNLIDLKGLLKVANVVDTAVEVMVVHNPRLLTSDIKGTVSKRAVYLEKVRVARFPNPAERYLSPSLSVCCAVLVTRTRTGNPYQYR